ncbi:hypothetical protein [Streptomyces niveus]|uniref:hypothetical protein n=1 Tax=Streptomyces niveus TaxID=193462 RepID=UPI00344439CA
MYNLETSGGWYIANGIIVHNCRCSLVPWKSEWQKNSPGTPLPLLLRRHARTGGR